MTNTIIFIVGLGAPAHLYADYLQNLKTLLPQSELLVLEWWSQDDFGMTQLQEYIGNSEVVLIGHSAGGSIALQAMMKWPALVKKIIMLDSHFLRTKNTLLSISRILDIMVNQDNVTIQNKVKDAYAPVVANSTQFTNALNYAIDWVNSSFDQACLHFNKMSAYSALLISFTNASYQMLDENDEIALLTQWKKFNVDVESLPMNHFDLIDKKHAAEINHLLVDWLHL